jgi:hypothetical protein
MRGDIVHQIYGLHEGREVDNHFGTCRTHAEAQAAIERLRNLHGPHWEERYHNKGFVIRTAVVDTDFEIPELPKPRDKYVAVGTAKPNAPGTWHSTTVRVYRRKQDSTELEQVCEFERNYSLLQTFEPFRKGGRDFALIARSYTKTAILDLASGQVIAEEVESNLGAGFCPVGFYVPDWWDVNDGSIIPGNPYWNTKYEWPLKTFGFVWGCHWGDDSSWKVQYLDLSEIEKGVIMRDERFGYVELATTGYESPSLNPAPREPDNVSRPPPFISIVHGDGKTRVTFALRIGFDLDTGACHKWKLIDTSID